MHALAQFDANSKSKLQYCFVCTTRTHKTGTQLDLKCVHTNTQTHRRIHTHTRRPLAPVMPPLLTLRTAATHFGTCSPPPRPPPCSMSYSSPHSPSTHPPPHPPTFLIVCCLEEGQASCQVLYLHKIVKYEFTYGCTRRVHPPPPGYQCATARPGSKHWTVPGTQVLRKPLACT